MVIQSIDHALGNLCPFVRPAWMGLKKTFSSGGTMSRIYRGTRISEDPFAECEAAALKGSCVMLAPFTSFSSDLKAALQFPPNLSPVPGKVAVLLVLEAAARPPVHEFSEYASEQEVLLPPFQSVKVRLAMRHGEHGRPQITLQDLELAMKDDPAFKTSALAPVRSTVELDGQRLMLEVPRGTSVAEAMKFASEEFGTGEITALSKDGISIGRSVSIEPGEYVAEQKRRFQRAVVAHEEGLPLRCRCQGGYSRPRGTVVFPMRRTTTHTPIRSIEPKNNSCQYQWCHSLFQSDAQYASIRPFTVETLGDHSASARAQNTG
jgi:hypothetical protein